MRNNCEYESFRFDTHCSQRHKEIWSFLLNIFKGKKSYYSYFFSVKRWEVERKKKWTTILWNKFSANMNYSSSILKWTAVWKISTTTFSSPPTSNPCSSWVLFFCFCYIGLSFLVFPFPIGIIDPLLSFSKFQQFLYILPSK